MRLASTEVLAVSAIAVMTLVGCALLEPDRIATEPPPAGTHSIFVVVHRYHAGLAVRARDVPQDAWPARSDFRDAAYLELGWGEREYYPRDDPGSGLALRALLTPSRSTINAVPINGVLTRSLPDSEIIELRVPQDGFARMVEFVRESHEFNEHGRPIAVPAGVQQQGRFYSSTRYFSCI